MVADTEQGERASVACYECQGHGILYDEPGEPLCACEFGECQCGGCKVVKPTVLRGDLCPYCDGVGYTSYVAYIEDQACGHCHGSGKRPTDRICVHCGRKMFSSREAHWECEIKNRATASGGSGIHQNPGRTEHLNGRIETRVCVRCEKPIALVDHNPYDARRCEPMWVHATGYERWSTELDAEHLPVAPYVIAEEP